MFSVVGTNTLPSIPRGGGGGQFHEGPVGVLGRLSRGPEVLLWQPSRSPFPQGWQLGVLGQGALPHRSGKRVWPQPAPAPTHRRCLGTSVFDLQPSGGLSAREPLSLGSPTPRSPPSGLTSQLAARAGGWLHRRWSPPLLPAAPPGRPLGLQGQQPRLAASGSPPVLGPGGRGERGRLGAGVGIGPAASWPFWPWNLCKVFKKKNSPEEDVTFS